MVPVGDCCGCPGAPSLQHKGPHNANFDFQYVGGKPRQALSDALAGVQSLLEFLQAGRLPLLKRLELGRAKQLFGSDTSLLEPLQQLQALHRKQLSKAAGSAAAAVAEHPAAAALLPVQQQQQQVRQQQGQGQVGRQRAPKDSAAGQASAGGWHGSSARLWEGIASMDLSGAPTHQRPRPLPLHEVQQPQQQQPQPQQQPQLGNFNRHLWRDGAAAEHIHAPPAALTGAAVAAAPTSTLAAAAPTASKRPRTSSTGKRGSVAVRIMTNCASASPVPQHSSQPGAGAAAAAVAGGSAGLLPPPLQPGSAGAGTLGLPRKIDPDFASPSHGQQLQEQGRRVQHKFVPGSRGGGDQVAFNPLVGDAGPSSPDQGSDIIREAAAEYANRAASQAAEKIQRGQGEVEALPARGQGTAKRARGSRQRMRQSQLHPIVSADACYHCVGGSELLCCSRCMVDVVPIVGSTARCRSRCSLLALLGCASPLPIHTGAGLV